MRSIGITATLLAMLALQGCYYLQPSRAPIETVFYPAHGELRADTVKDLVVMLPGIGDYPEAFARHQFVGELQASGLPLDAVAVNAHLGYYNQRSLLIRLKEDVVDPAKAQGYERIHFVGISLGGYGTLLYMRNYPEDVSSAILIAPYLGRPEHYAHLTTDGMEPVLERENLWPWLQSLSGETLARIYLGFGASDTYAESHQLLRDMLPRDHSTVVAGAHRWTTWQRLWPELLLQAQGVKGEGLDRLAKR
ncbi:alpha/beta hydrolase-fold protein [Gilvimarinus sp. F26214L]|uniref:alpha/beta hydrolase-fold protein n=1 Tax=Gilvimarinus sp. DZF01 TaxID=3461371 RepID=UPI0040451ACD